MEDRKRKREEEIEEEEKKKVENEWSKNFEESRQERVNSWQTFQKGGAKKKKKTSDLKVFRPPKLKMEKRA
jgi:DnaJ family protein C protein 8